MVAMKWKDVAELLGFAAIVASMAAVAYELRQTKDALIASTYQARAFDAIAESNFVSDSEYLLPILVATDNGSDIDGFANLNEMDRLRLVNFFRSRMIDWDNEYYQYQHGYLDEDFFETTTKAKIKQWAPRWRALGLREARSEFSKLVDELTGDTQAKRQE